MYYKKEFGFSGEEIATEYLFNLRIFYFIKKLYLQNWRNRYYRL